MHVVYLVNVNICKVNAKIVKGPKKTTFYGPVLFYFCPRKLILRDLKHYSVAVHADKPYEPKTHFIRLPKAQSRTLNILVELNCEVLYLEKVFQACLTIKVYDCYILYRFIQRK